MPRVNFISFTFLCGFGLGAFVGVIMALVAIAVATPEPEPAIVQPDPAAAAGVTSTPAATVIPTQTVDPTPAGIIRTRATLNVHIGPAAEYAVLGTLAGGSQVEVQGRDDPGAWVAITFPPNSSARGWIPVTQVTGITFAQVLGLEVVPVTLIETSPGDSVSGDSTTPVLSDPFPPLLVTPDNPNPRVPRTPTPIPSIGPTDLAIAGVEIVAGGRVRVLVENLGPGDAPAVRVEVSAAGYESETLRSAALLRSGDTVALQTSDFRINAPVLVTVEIDPDGQLPDLDPSDNTLRLDLTP
jgi:hypothetical protein